MFPLELPPLPPWENLHPLVVHFPIGLLLVAPLFVLLAALLGSYGRWFGVSALLLLVVGTVGAQVSVLTGDAAYDVLEEIDDDGWEVVELHQEAAKETRTLYVWLTVFYAVILALPLMIWKLNSWKYWLPTNVLTLGLLLLANVQLSNAAHLGGRLVYQYGGRVVLAAEVEEGEEGEEVSPDEDDDDDVSSEEITDEYDSGEAAAEMDELGEEESVVEEDAELESPIDEPATDTPVEEPPAETDPEPAPSGEPAEEETPAEEAAKEEPAEAEAKEPTAEPDSEPPTGEPAKEAPEEVEPPTEPPVADSPGEPPGDPSEPKDESSES